MTLTVHSVRGYKDVGKNLHPLLGDSTPSLQNPIENFFLDYYSQVLKATSGLLLLTKAFQYLLSHRPIRCGFSRTTHILQLSKFLSALLVRNSKILTCKKNFTSHPFVVVGVSEESQIFFNCLHTPQNLI